mmetsp:Transcript_52464/g.137380  ORF Transcript_52464/g.137380 Transcript_52464/m.137380 type:complete len:110 (+) Transcript_52464:14065-14394(+)
MENVYAWDACDDITAVIFKISTPELCVHDPVDANTEDADETARAAESGVVLPVSPAIVKIGYAGLLSEGLVLHCKTDTEGNSWTVMEFGAQGHGVLWLAVFTVQINGAM